MKTGHAPTILVCLIFLSSIAVAAEPESERNDQLSQVIKDFVDASSTPYAWTVLESTVEDFRRRPGGALPFRPSHYRSAKLWEHIEAWRNEKHNAGIVRWPGDIKIYLQEFEIYSEFVGELATALELSIGRPIEILKYTPDRRDGISIIFVGPDREIEDPRYCIYRCMDDPRIRPIGGIRYKFGFPFPVGGQNSWDVDPEYTFMKDSIIFTGPHVRMANVEGFIAVTMNGDIRFSHCLINKVYPHPENFRDTAKHLIAECVVRSLGLPSAIKSSESNLLRLESGLPPPTSQKPSDYERLLLQLLYDPSLVAGMGEEAIRNHLYQILRKHRFDER